MTKWAERITTAILLTMHDCYHNAAAINYQEWEGGDNGGVKAFLISIIYKEIKRAYQAGYEQGARDSVKAMQEMGCVTDTGFPIEFSEADNRIGGERKFLEWEKEQ